MKILVLEGSEQITNIYKKIFLKKKIAAEFVKNEFEFLERFNEKYDFFILENPISSPNFVLNENNRKMNQNQKFIFLSSHLNKKDQIANLRKETREILEKPFAMITVLSKLEFEIVKKAIAL